MADVSWSPLDDLFDPENPDENAPIHLPPSPADRLLAGSTPEQLEQWAAHDRLAQRRRRQPRP